MQKPSFNLSELGESKTLNRCRAFLPRLLESNTNLTDDISKGDTSKVIDSGIHYYRGQQCPEAVDIDCDGSDIVLDVGVGVFDVNNPSVEESNLKECGITTVTLEANNLVFGTEEPLIREIGEPEKKPL